MRKIFPVLALMALLLAGCKENTFLDWKTQNELFIEHVEQMVPKDADYYSPAPIQTTSSGLRYQVLYPGIDTDVRPSSASTVYVNYEGWFINGYKFDSGTYSSMAMSQVVSGFAEGLKKVRNQGDIILFIPWDLAYGEDGSGTEGGSSFIPPYSTLIFKVHVCAVAN